MDNVNVKVQIGARYHGPQWDRPALRQMPPGWVLEETKPAPSFHMNADRWFFLIVLVIGVFAILTTVQQLFAGVLK